MDACYVKVWTALVLLTGLLALASRLGPGPALLGLLTVTPLKAGLVFYFFMHLRDEGPLLRGVVALAAGTLLIFFGLLCADVALR
jgi:cytochrome c oxidase subunit 4